MEKTFSIRGRDVGLAPEEAVDLADAIAVGRPVPRREYDQICMRASHLLELASFLSSRVAGGRVLLLGDEDGLAMALAALDERLGLGMRSMAVLDFDERVLDAHERAFAEASWPLSCETGLYNVIDPAPEGFRGRFDFFIANPPYGSRNGGLSVALWLRRCLELCSRDVSGCVVMPWEGGEPWVAEARANVEARFADWGLGVSGPGPEQMYHLDDRPRLRSRAIVVGGTSALAGAPSERFGYESVRCLYGGPRPLPRYILRDDANPLGRESGSWYSEEGWRESVD